MFLLGVCLCLGIVNGILPETSNTDMDIIANMETNMLHRHTLNNMFKEVEELMEDTQQILQDTVHQIDNETANSELFQQNVSLNLQSNSSLDISAGNQSDYLEDMTNKTAGNTTDETIISKGTQHSEKRNNVDHECVIDEDCEKGKYCLYETSKSKCLPCKQLDAILLCKDYPTSRPFIPYPPQTCSKDEECCTGHLCVWGQCTQNSTKGEAGTICQYQSDCKEEFCCAFHKALLFPVCSSKPIERERCIITANHLMDLVSWDMEGDGPQIHCPCAGDLQCQHQGRGALCLKSRNLSEEELADTLYSEVDYII